MIVGASLCLHNQNNWVFTRTRNRVTSSTSEILRLCKTQFICLDSDLEITSNAESGTLENLDKLRKIIFLKK